MILSYVNLKNFRRHKNLFLNFSEGVNYIVGGNGQGKTSILESIYFLCTTKGYNSKKEKDAVNFESREFEITGIFKDLTENKIRMLYSAEENRKYYFQNDKQVLRSADIIGSFPVVVLTPADHAITQGAPGDRRRFFDSVISQSSQLYLKTLLDYNKTLRQRASLLNQLKERRNKSLFEELEAWTDKLIKTGSQIINYRRSFIYDFTGFVKDSYKMIMGHSENPLIEYSFLDNFENENIEDLFAYLIAQKKEEEIKRGSSLVGPHRDDFIFKLDDLELKIFGSQGQHKTFQVALKFAQFFYLKENTGKNPIFLFDDVFGELDTERSSKISEYLGRIGQSFITITDFSNLPFIQSHKKDNVIKLSQGEAQYA